MDSIIRTPFWLTETPVQCGSKVKSDCLESPPADYNPKVYEATASNTMLNLGRQKTTNWDTFVCFGYRFTTDFNADLAALALNGKTAFEAGARLWS